MKAKILAALRETEGYVSGQELCERFGVSRTAVWKAINQLKKDGYEIEAVQNRGYRIVGAPDILSENELSSIRKTDWIGKKIYYYDETDSTNVRASRLAEEGAEHGTLVVADQQDAGKGRRGRGWSSLPGTGIFMTLILKPELNPSNASMLTLVAAMAVAKGITRCTGMEAKIKWPNDIIINNKKVAGILTELSAEIDRINYIILGIGINVKTMEFSQEISEIATSLYKEGHKISRVDIIRKILKEFENLYLQYINKELKEETLDICRQHSAIIGKDVYLIKGEEKELVKCLDMNQEGNLVVRTKDNIIKEIMSGEVSIRGVKGYV